MTEKTEATPELDEKTFAKIEALADEGEDLLDAGEFLKAADKFKAAFAMIPEPFQDWEASIWLLTSLGESYFLAQDYKNAKDAFSKAAECPDAEDSPPIFLRLGQVEFELGNKEEAGDLLLRAYEAEGAELFDDGDEKYFEFLNLVYELDGDEN